MLSPLGELCYICFDLPEEQRRELVRIANQMLAGTWKPKGQRPPAKRLREGTQGTGVVLSWPGGAR